VDFVHGFARPIQENTSRTVRKGQQKRLERSGPFSELWLWINMDGEPAINQNNTIIFKNEFLLNGNKWKSLV